MTMLRETCAAVLAVVGVLLFAAAWIIKSLARQFIALGMWMLPEEGPILVRATK